LPRFARASTLSIVATNASPVAPAVVSRTPRTIAAGSGEAVGGARRGAAVGTKRPTVRLLLMKYAFASRVTSGSVSVARRSR
jgi:hypothetical protein